MMNQLADLPVQHIFVLIVVTVAAVTDLKHGRILNILTFPAMLAGLILNTALSGFSGFTSSFIAMIAGIMIYLPAGAIGLIGMGDVKLMGAIGAICGINFTISVFLYASALGLPHAFFVQYLNYGGQSLQMLIASFSSGAFRQKTIQKENANNTGKYRFLIGIDIFIATIIAVFHTFAIF